MTRSWTRFRPHGYNINGVFRCYRCWHEKKEHQTPRQFLPSCSFRYSNWLSFRLWSGVLYVPGYFGKSSNCLDWCFGGEWFGILTCPRKYGPHKGWLTTVGPKGFMISSNLGTKNTQGRAIHYNIHVSLRWIFPFFFVNTGIQGWYGIYIYLIWIKSTQKDRKIFPKAWALSSLKCTGPGRQGSPQEGEFKRVYITKRCYPEDVHVNCMVLLCENIGRLMDKCQSFQMIQNKRCHYVYLLFLFNKPYVVLMLFTSANAPVSFKQL